MPKGSVIKRAARTENSEKAAIQPDAAPQWIGDKVTAGTTTFVTVLPVGWIGEWHENPRPQWIIPLSGAGLWKSMDGTRVEMGRGEISFGEDHAHVPDRRQHGDICPALSGLAPAVLMLVQFDAAPTLAPACRFR